MNAMSCMKCGREIALGQVFCKDCLDDMSHYPVNPATPVQIPVQPPVAHTNRRTARTKKARKPEEQILRLRKTVRTQTIVIIFLVAVLIVTGLYGYKKLCNHDQTYRPGENYISSETSPEADPNTP